MSASGVMRLILGGRRGVALIWRKCMAAGLPNLSGHDDPASGEQAAMSVRNLDHLFSPRSVAVVGVSARAGNLGAIVLRNLREGGFEGPVWAVNRHSGEVDGVQLWRDIASLPGVPDLAV